MASRKDSKGRVLQKGEYERSDVRYQFSYCTVVGSRKIIYASSLEELRVKERDCMIASLIGAKNYDSNVSVNFMYDRALCLKPGIRRTTYSGYLLTYNRHIRAGIGKMPIARLKYSDILAFYTYLYKDKKLAIGTIENINRQLVSAFKLAYKDGIIAKNPMDGALGTFKRSVSTPEKKVRALTIEQQRVFINYIDKHPRWGRYHSIFQIMLGTGLRVGELSALRWQDVDLENRIIEVNHCVGRVYKEDDGATVKCVISPLKTKSGKRRIPIMKPVVDAFIEEYKIAEAKGFNSPTVDGYSNFIFTTKYGNLYFSTRLDYVLKEIVKAYNKEEEVLSKEEKRKPFFLPRITNHMLRHTFCTRLCERDVNIKVIQTLMGHSTINITLDIYAEVSYAKQFQEIDRMADELDVF